MNDRINRKDPQFGKGRKWSDDWQAQTRRMAGEVNTPRARVQQVQPDYVARLRDRLGDDNRYVQQLDEKQAAKARRKKPKTATANASRSTPQVAPMKGTGPLGWSDEAREASAKVRTKAAKPPRESRGANIRKLTRRSRSLKPDQPITKIDGRPVYERRVAPGNVTSDAKTFQFKADGDAAGVTDRLRGVTKWDPTASGKTIMFERADGTLVVADGHQRTGLAKRLAAEGANIKLDAFVYREADGWKASDVRALAAMKNLKELSGSALDMAKVLRERPDLVDGSLAMSDGKMRQAKQLARLSDPAFRQVVGGVVRPELAAAVGEGVSDPKLHAGIMEQLSKSDADSVQKARLFVSQAQAAGTTKQTQTGLFGAETKTRSLINERVAVLDRALTTLKQDKRVFATLEREAGRIEGAGNKLARGTNIARANQSGSLAQLVEKLATKYGPVSTELDKAARLVADGGAKPQVAARTFVQSLQDLTNKGGINALTGDTKTVAPKTKPMPAPAQTTLLPEPTTKEKLQVMAAKPLRGNSAPLDTGLFDGGRGQMDLVDEVRKKGGKAGWSDEARVASAEVRAAKPAAASPSTISKSVIKRAFAGGLVATPIIAGMIAADATHSQALASGRSKSSARRSAAVAGATTAAVTTGVVAAFGAGIKAVIKMAGTGAAGKAVSVAASGATRVLLPLTVATTAYGAVRGFRKGGLTGAARGAGNAFIDPFSAAATFARENVATAKQGQQASGAALRKRSRGHLNTAAKSKAKGKGSVVKGATARKASRKRGFADPKIQKAAQEARRRKGYKRKSR
jgi:hypothetical protein